MTDTDREEFAVLLTQALGFWGHTLSPFALSVWWQACQGCDLEQVRRALSAHALDPDRGAFAPKPADIVRVLRGTVADRSLIAWGKVLDAMQRVGAYRSVVFDDGAIHAAVSDMGGWPAICRGNVDDLPFTQKRFCDLHRAYSLRPDAAYPARLIGEHEERNRLTGHEIRPPTLIGDAERARLVAAAGVAGPKTRITDGVAAQALPGLASTPSQGPLRVVR